MQLHQRNASLLYACAPMRHAQQALRITTRIGAPRGTRSGSSASAQGRTTMRATRQARSESSPARLCRCCESTQSRDLLPAGLHVSRPPSLSFMRAASSSACTSTPGAASRLHAGGGVRETLSQSGAHLVRNAAGRSIGYRRVTQTTCEQAHG